MGEDYYDFVGVNSDTIIAYGRRADGTEFHRELNAKERAQVYAMVAKQDREKDKLLRKLDKANAY